MTLLTLLFSSEGTCVGMHVYGSMCWSWRTSTLLFLRTKHRHTHPFAIITGWQQFSVTHTHKLVPVKSYLLASSKYFPGLFSRVEFQNSMCHCSVPQLVAHYMWWQLCKYWQKHLWLGMCHTQFLSCVLPCCDLLCLWPAALVPAFPLQFSLVFIPCSHCDKLTCFSLALKAYLAQSCSHTVSAVLKALFLPIPIPC